MVNIIDFPIKIIDKNKVIEYASKLILGQRQLLITKNLEIYLTDGFGGYDKINTGNGGTSDFEMLSNKPKINGITILGDKTSKDLGLLDSSYASDINEGSVKMADNLSTIKNTSPLQYYGTDNDNKLGMHYFPINMDKTNTGIEQKIALDAKANTDITINSALDISDNKIVIDAYKLVDGTQDIHTTKVFDNTEAHNFFYDKDNVAFTDSMHVKKEHEYAITLNVDSVYESEIINKNDFIEILGLEMK